MTTAHIDFETRSTTDLKKTGVERYAQDPNTGIWCMAYAFDDNPVHLWTPDGPDPMHLLDHIENGGKVVAHNVPFELTIWNRKCVAWGWPKLRFRQTEDTLHLAYAMALPGSLEKAAAALGIEVQKDMKGHRRMLQMAQPRKVDQNGTISWWDDDQRKQELYDYCMRDVEVERELHNRLRPLSEFEQRVRHVDAQINARGVYVDMGAARAVREAVEQHKEVLDERMSRATEGMVKQCSWVSVLTDFVRFNGVETPGIAKADVKAILAEDETPASVRQALEIRQEAGKTSTAKIDTMLNVASNTDQRLRWMFQYHGAGTGRWAGRKVQLQNMPRGSLKPKEIDHAIDLFRSGQTELIEILYGNLLDVASSCLRGLLRAEPGKILRAADFNNIEGRMLAWLAGESWKLEAFRKADRGEGPEIYKLTAGGILGKTPEQIDGGERQAFGKVPELALGYQGGVGAFQTMAKTYGVQMGEHYDTVIAAVPDWVLDTALDAWSTRGKDSGLDKRTWVASEAVKVAWRDRHPRTQQFWWDIEDAAVEAVRSPGAKTRAGRIRFRMAGSFLWCQLPSGRLLCYPYPQIQEKETPWGAMKPVLTYMTVTENYKWARAHTYGGKLTENVDQAASRDLLAYSMLNVANADKDIVLHVHDELVEEARPDQGSLAELCAMMEKLPDWATGLPVKAEGWEGVRFRKD